MDKQMIYVVMKGIYSDRHILGVTTSKKRAEDIKKFFTSSDDDYYDEPEIEVFEDGVLDPMIHGYADYYTVWINEDGKILSITKSGKLESEYIQSDPVFERVDNRRLHGYRCNCMASSEDVAAKIASDLHAKRIAEEQGL